MMTFELYAPATKRGHGPVTVPRVTFNFTQIVLSRPACQMLGEPEYVEYLFDRDQGVVGRGERTQ